MLTKAEKARVRDLGLAEVERIFNLVKSLSSQGALKLEVWFVADPDGVTTEGRRIVQEFQRRLTIAEHPWLSVGIKSRLGRSGEDESQDG